ncbi:MAG TPA: hypothetical protein VGD40_23200 [Chryseosolibacter sp.]
MNRIILVTALIVVADSLTAQTLSEWVRQKETQKKYLVQQVAALKLYLGYLKKGYSIADKGLALVGDIRQGKFDIDFHHIECLKNPSAVVRGSARVAAISKYRQMIAEEFRRLAEAVSESELFAGDEKQFLSHVISTLLRESELMVDDLAGILSTSDFIMTDDERIRQVDRLHTAMKEMCVFTKCFTSSTLLLQADRRKSESERRTMQNLIFKE